MSAQQMRQPLAERFVADDEAFIQDSRYQGVVAKGAGMMLEVHFPDGSVAHCEYGQWAVGPLGVSKEQPT